MIKSDPSFAVQIESAHDPNPKSTIKERIQKTRTKKDWWPVIRVLARGKRQWLRTNTARRIGGLDQAQRIGHSAWTTCAQEYQSRLLFSFYSPAILHFRRPHDHRERGERERDRERQENEGKLRAGLEGGVPGECPCVNEPIHSYDEGRWFRTFRSQLYVLAGGKH